MGEDAEAGAVHGAQQALRLRRARELEVPVHEDDGSASERLNRQLAQLGLTWEQCIRASYLDLAIETK